MDVSVVVPSLNEEQGIKKCLQSIAKQETNRDFEIIVSDGGSTDRTIDIAQKYADKVVKSRKGISTGRNSGAKAAKGEKLIFIDSDSYIPKNYIDSVAPALENKKISGVSCAFEFDRSTKTLDMISDICNRYLVLRGMDGKGEILGFNNAIRAKDFKRVGGFPKVPLEDHVIARKLWKKGRVVFLPEPRAITSSRRIDEKGTLETIIYYSNLTIASELPKFKFKGLLKHKDYEAIR
jgi:glycosyltransferase involved in cell wall biosynthesis